MPDAFAGACYLWASNVISTAVKLAPADTGFLRSTRYVTKPVGFTRVGGIFPIEIGFSAPYAVYVHEINRNYTVGEWKFLTKALNYHTPTAFTEIASLTRRLAATGSGLSNAPTTHPTEPFIGPPPPRPSRRRPGESAASHRRRLARLRQSRAVGLQRNRERIAGELLATLEAQQTGRRPPRPGRGG